MTKITLKILPRNGYKKINVFKTCTDKKCKCDECFETKTPRKNKHRVYEGFTDNLNGSTKINDDKITNDFKKYIT